MATGLDILTTTPNKGRHWITHVFLFLLDLFICLFVYLRKEGERGQGERKSSSRLFIDCGTQCRAQSQDPKIMTWAIGRCFTDWATQESHFLIFCLSIYNKVPRILGPFFMCWYMKAHNKYLSYKCIVPHAHWYLPLWLLANSQRTRLHSYHFLCYTQPLNITHNPVI